MTDDYLPNASGDSPLAKVGDWVNCTCPKCGGKAKRETDTMPNWAGSSWYWLRYTDPHNDKAFADPEKLKYWGSVDCYNGGTEHITRHVLYAFFWQNFLYDIGVVPTRDPFIRKLGSGLILDDQGKKMSKSSTNGVSPMEVIDKYGADVTRMHVHYLAAFEDSTPWTFNGIEGGVKFLNRVWRLPDILRGDALSSNHINSLHRLIKKMGEDIEAMRLNTSIAECMKFVNDIYRDGFITKEELRTFIILLNPIVPHITSELYEIVFGGKITDEHWPVYDEKYLQDDVIEYAVQINSRIQKHINVPNDATSDEVVAAIRAAYPNFLPDGTAVKKTVFVKGKLVNFIV